MSWLLLCSAFGADQIRVVPRDGTLAELLAELESEAGDHTIWVTQDAELEPTTLDAIAWDTLMIGGVGDPQIRLVGAGVMLEIASPFQGLTIRDLRIDGSDEASLLTTTDDADIELHNVVVDHVYSSGDGGLLSMEGPSSTLLIDGSTFDSGQADNGGFIHISSPSATVDIVASRFSAGSATDAGGAIRALSGDIHIHNSSFEDNDAVDGGALNIANATAVEIEDCRFGSNVSSGGGSAVELTDLATPSTVPAVLRNNLFAQNDAMNGTLRLTGVDSAYRLFRNRFCANTAQEGAAIHASSLVQQSSSYFWQNTAQDDGGAVFVESGTFNDLNSTYRANEASRGEAVHAEGSYTAEHAVYAGHQNGTAFDGGGSIALTNSFSKDNAEVNNTDVSEVQRLWFRSDGCGLKHARLRCNSIDVVDLANGRDPGALQGCSEDDESDDDGLSRPVEMALGTDPTLDDTDEDGLSDRNECPPLEDLLSNGGFQYSGQAFQGGPGWRYHQDTEIPGWTWAGGVGELRGPDYSFDTDLDTDCTIDTDVTYAEINPDGASEMYQDLQLLPGQSVRIGFETTRRNVGDEITLQVGPYDGTFTPAMSIDYVATEDWVYHFVDFTPTTNDPTRILFRSLQTVDDNFSAFIDNVAVVHRPDFDGDGIIDCLDEDADDDGELDADDPDPRNPDTDGDNIPDGSDAYPTLADVDGDGVHVPEGDCDDLNPLISPNADEDCSSIDRNCDGSSTDGATDVQSLWPDADEDGFGDQLEPAQDRCPEPGWVPSNTDCNDSDASVYPGAMEACDFVDNDCDDEVDEGLGQLWYQDVDGDGYGNPVVAVMACAQPLDFVADNTDCDDSAASTNPGAPEICDNEEDDDCDGDIDIDTVFVDWYPDDDGDGFGDLNAQPVNDCAPPTDGLYVADNNEDCDDSSPEIAPGVPESCDGIDEDCDGLVDEDPSDGVTTYADADGDGYGDLNQPVVACEPPANTAANDLDCDDSNPAIHPDTLEICDGVDQNCNGQIDEDAPGLPQYADSDGDGFGTGPTLPVCGDVEGFSMLDGDCDDEDPGVFPGAVEAETCDGVDQDCDGDLIDESPEARWLADCDGDDVTSLYAERPECDAVLICPPFAEPDCDDADPELGGPLDGECPDAGDCAGEDCSPAPVTGCACDQAEPFDFGIWRRRR